MIYVGKVIPSLMNEAIHQDIIEYLAEYEPQQVHVSSDKEQQKKIKTTVLQGFICGEMNALIRKTENVSSRDALILDLDDVIISADELKKEIHRKFSKYSYALFPSVSNGLKGVRYRLVLPLDKSVKRAEYSLLVKFFNERVLQGIINIPDKSNVVWSQIQLLPVITQYHSKEDILQFKTNRKIEVDVYLEIAKKWERKHHLEPRANQEKMTKKSNRYRSKTTELFESLTLGCETGNRNNRIAQITGGLLVRGVNVKEAYKLVCFANQHFSEPLEADELDKTFFSIAKKELKR